jgi:hypothetical protein
MDSNLFEVLIRIKAIVVLLSKGFQGMEADD